MIYLLIVVWKLSAVTRRQNWTQDLLPFAHVALEGIVERRRISIVWVRLRSWQPRAHANVRWCRIASFLRGCFRRRTNEYVHWMLSYTTAENVSNIVYRSAVPRLAGSFSRKSVWRQHIRNLKKLTPIFQRRLRSFCWNSSQGVVVYSDDAFDSFSNRSLVNWQMWMERCGKKKAWSSIQVK